MENDHTPLAAFDSLEDEENKEVLVSAFVAEIKETFQTLFFPGHCLQATAKPVVDCRLAGKLDFVLEHEDFKDRLDLELLFTNTLADLLLSFEETIKGLLHVVKGTKTLTPKDLKDELDKYKADVPTHLWLGANAVDSLFQKADIWVPFYEPVTKHELALVGHLGTVKNLSSVPLTVYTDIFRYDTLRTLDFDEWCLVTEKHPKVWVEWSEVKHEDSSSIFTVTQYVGKEK